MNFEKEDNRPFLIINFTKRYKKIFYTKTFFYVGITVIIICSLLSFFYLLSEDKNNINKVLLSRESSLNTAIIKSENNNNILEAEILILKEKLKIEKKEKELLQTRKISKYLSDEEVSGSGIEIILADSILNDFENKNNIVHNTDLLKIVNFLWANDAEAISINNERIGLNTHITCAGATILVDNKRINNPFVIKAILRNLDEEEVKNSSIMLSLLLRGIDIKIIKKEKLTIPPKNTKEKES